MKLEALYQIFLKHPLISTDSRKIEKESIFFALKGENFNGNAFALTALEKGASYAVVDEEQYSIGEKTVLVDNVLQTLQELARLHRKRMGIPILAITGTNGKTTTKELTASVLSKRFKIVYTKGNLNNHIGVPLTILSIKPGTELGIIEMGANHPGEIAELCDIALPDFGLITNVGKAHLEGFGSFEGVIQTKTELYRFLGQNGGTIFINFANPILISHAGNLKKIGYSAGKADEGLVGEVISSDPYLVFRARFPKGWLYVKTRLAGVYNLENALAAAAIGLHFGIDPTEIANAIEDYHPTNNRSQLLETERNSLLMDAYNANPTSTRAALESFSQLKTSKKGVILGDMLELGSAAQEEHQKIIDFLNTLKIDLAFLVGPVYANCHLPENYRHFAEAGSLSHFLKEEKLSGYHFLIKGSRGMKLESILPDL